MAKTFDYPLAVHPLPAEDGGSCFTSFTDFSDCISDGATVEEAIANGRRAPKAFRSTRWSSACWRKV